MSSCASCFCLPLPRTPYTDLTLFVLLCLRGSLGSNASGVAGVSRSINPSFDMLDRRTRDDEGTALLSENMIPVLAPLARPNDRLRGTWPPSTMSGVFIPELIRTSLSGLFSTSDGGLSCFEN